MSMLMLQPAKKVQRFEHPITARGGTLVHLYHHLCYYGRPQSTPGTHPHNSHEAEASMKLLCWHAHILASVYAAMLCHPLTAAPVIQKLSRPACSMPHNNHTHATWWHVSTQCVLPPRITFSKEDRVFTVYSRIALIATSVAQGAAGSGGAFSWLSMLLL